MLGIRWDEAGGFSEGAPNHLLALQPAPKSLLWKAGSLLVNPEDGAARADAYARMFAETTFLQQLRSLFRSKAEGLLDDLLRGFDFQGGALAEKRSELARRMRQGEEALAPELEEVKQEQTTLETQKSEALLYAQRRPDLIDIVKLERVALATCPKHLLSCLVPTPHWLMTPSLCSRAPAHSSLSSWPDCSHPQACRCGRIHHSRLP
jgi:hypothetical protein